MSIKNMKIIKLIKNTLIGSFLLLVGCSNPISSEDEATLSFDMRLPKDGDGFYHLTLGPENLPKELIVRLKYISSSGFIS